MLDVKVANEAMSAGGMTTHPSPKNFTDRLTFPTQRHQPENGRE